MPSPTPVQIGPFDLADRDQVVALSPRLTVGVAAWRDPAKVAVAVRGWVEGAVAASPAEDHAVFVAKSGGRVAGVVTVEERTHWTGAVDAYVGELIVAADVEGLGIGRALMAAAEQWACERGLEFLTLETGAANSRARGFYRTLGYAEEDVRLTKPLRG